MPSTDASRAAVMNRIMGVLLRLTGPTYLSGRAGSSCFWSARAHSLLPADREAQGDGIGNGAGIEPTAIRHLAPMDADSPYYWRSRSIAKRQAGDPGSAGRLAPEPSPLAGESLPRT